MRRLFQILAPLAMILLFNASVHAQDKNELRGRDGDGLTASAGEKNARARIRSLCATLYPDENNITGARRTNYPIWMKRLLCDYMIADFTGRASRDAYVEQVLSALRTHGAGAWRFQHHAPIVHIVTEDPAYVERSGSTATVKRFKNNGILRSLHHPASASIGIHQSKFITPRAKTRIEADKRIPNAEDAIQRILSMAIVADMLAGTPDAVSKSAAEKRINAGLSDFQRSVLTAAEPPKIKKSSGFPPRPAAVATPENQESYSPPGPDAGLNIVVRVPKEAKKRKTRKPGKRKSGRKGKGKKVKTIGLTRSIYRVGLKSFLVSRLPKDLESIEPIYKYKLMHSVKAKVHTYIVVERFDGIPSGNKVIRVFGVDGEDCTANIARHEAQHVKHFWMAWREQVIQAIEKDLSGRKFKDAKDAKVRINSGQKEEKIGRTLMRVTKLNIRGNFLFAKGAKRSAESALKKIRASYKKSYNGIFTKKFLKKADELAFRYHKTEQVGLDDHCNPVKDLALARHSFGKLGKSKKVRR